MDESEQLHRAQEQLATRNENQPFLCVLVLKFVALDAITKCDISHRAFDSEEIVASGSGLSQYKRKKLQQQQEDRRVLRVKPTRQVVLSLNLVVLNKTDLQQLTNSKTQYGTVQCRSQVGSIVLRVFSHRPSCVSSPQQFSSKFKYPVEKPSHITVLTGF